MSKHLRNSRKEKLYSLTERILDSPWIMVVFDSATKRKCNLGFTPFFLLVTRQGLRQTVLPWAHSLSGNPPCQLRPICKHFHMVSLFPFLSIYITMTDTCMTTQSELFPFPVNAVCEKSAPEWSSELLLSFSGFKHPRISNILFHSSNGSDSQDTNVVYIVYEPFCCL